MIDVCGTKRGTDGNTQHDGPDQCISHACLHNFHPTNRHPIRFERRINGSVAASYTVQRGSSVKPGPTKVGPQRQYGGCNLSSVAPENTDAGGPLTTYALWTWVIPCAGSLCCARRNTSTSFSRASTFFVRKSSFSRSCCFCFSSSCSST
jgi:hypothetical protein